MVLHLGDQWLYWQPIQGVSWLPLGIGSSFPKIQNGQTEEKKWNDFDVSSLIYLFIFQTAFFEVAGTRAYPLR